MQPFVDKVRMIMFETESPDILRRDRVLILNNTLIRKEYLFLKVRQFQTYQIQRAIPREVLPPDLSILLQMQADRLYLRGLKVSVSLHIIDEAVPSGDGDGWSVSLFGEATYFAKLFGRYEALGEQFAMI